MKLTKVLLRWYKSFHLNYRGDFGKGEVTPYKPWNRLAPKHTSQDEFPFIEIPIDSEITTVVGANESGKSHLLNAISKIVKGVGLDGAEKFSQTDLCHYAGIRTRNVEAWPNIGVQFSLDSSKEFEALNTATGNAITPPARALSFALILAPDQDAERPALLFVEPSEQSISLSEDQLESVRALLPSVQFIDSTARLAGEIPLSRLLAAYGDSDVGSITLPSRSQLEKAASVMLGLESPVASQVVSAEFVEKVKEVKRGLRSLDAETATEGLEIHLFKEILGISLETLRQIYHLSGADRGFVEGLIAKWNDEIKDRLNLAHFWSQDEQFELSVNYKDGILYFEIGDKTGSIYTFNERSSGLKSFLSYYIQAKAMEMTSRNRNAIILMDEPDSALSILGQRNLLRVFESLVRPESSGETCQLIYTTHSPYLINRNFPKRIRVVKKEEAEQGSQFIERARSRRYEPVRTALGIDSAPSLFLGSDNILLEGATDQFFLAEMIRLFATPQNVGQFLDLNSVEIVSADGVGNIENVLNQSHWADEPIPSTVVLVDGDKAGLDVITQLATKRIIDKSFLIVVSEIVKPYGENLLVVTTEDLVPKAIYLEGLKKYLNRWWPTLVSEHGKLIDQTLVNADFGSGGLAASTKVLFKQIQPEHEGDYDKMGILQEIMGVSTTLFVANQPNEATKLEVTPNADILQLQKNVVAVCDSIRECLAEARAATAKHSTTQAIKRIIHDFNRLNKANVPVTSLQQLFSRLEREVAPVGEDAQGILNRLIDHSSELTRLRAAGQERVVGEQWIEWQGKIEALKNNPLAIA